MSKKNYREARRRALEYHESWVALITQAEGALRAAGDPLIRDGLVSEKCRAALDAIKKAKGGP